MKCELQDHLQEMLGKTGITVSFVQIYDDPTFARKKIVKGILRKDGDALLFSSTLDDDFVDILEYAEKRFKDRLD